MGLLLEVRLKFVLVFNYVMFDLFGLYIVRGEVQKCISGKVYGVMFIDFVIRVVYIEVVFGYDISNFLMVFSRFVSF